jgi:hypothetical protein
MKLVCRTTGAPGGANASIKGWGFFVSGGVAATANSGLQVTFGGGAAAHLRPPPPATPTLSFTYTAAVV